MPHTERKELDTNIGPDPQFSASSIFKIDGCFNGLIKTSISSEILSKSSDQSADSQQCNDTLVHINCNIPKLNEIIPIPIEEKSLEKICFSETLVISLKTDENELFDFNNLEEVGKLNCSIENSKEVLISLVKSSLTDEKNYFLDFISFNTKNSRDSIHYSKESGDVLNIFPFASFIILARYLINNQFSGETILDFENRNGKAFASKIIIEEPTLRKINGMEMSVTRITQNDEEFITYFLESGHILRHESKNSSYVIHLNPLSPIPPNNFLTNLDQEWEKDIQLYSMYLDKKDNMKNESMNFLKDNPQLKNLIQDYLSVLLLSKPENVIEFSMEFFRGIAEGSSVQYNNKS